MDKIIAIVTGANKGIGYGIVRGLASRLTSGSMVYLTARNIALGEAALKTLIQELGSKRTCDVLFHQLDITDEGSCGHFAEYLRDKHGSISVLINNAGFAFKVNATEPAGVQADKTIAINYYGTKLVSKYLIPLINDGGRIVNIASQGGVMILHGKESPTPYFGYYSKELIDKFQDPNLTEADVDEFVERYKRLSHENRQAEGGYPGSAYRVSKAAEIAYTILQYRELNKRGIIVNACCPGYVDTDMTSHKGHLTIDQGADTPIYLATSSDVPNGKFVYQRKEIEWIR